MLQSSSSSVPSRLPPPVPRPRLPHDDLDFRYLFIGCGMRGTSMEITTPLNDVKTLKRHFRSRTSKECIHVLTDKKRDITTEDVLRAIRNVTSNLSNKTVLFVYLGFHGNVTDEGPVLLTHPQQVSSTEQATLLGSTIRDALVLPIQRSGAFCFLHLDACYFSGNALGFTERYEHLSAHPVKALSDRTNVVLSSSLVARKRKLPSDSPTNSPKKSCLRLDQANETQLIVFPILVPNTEHNPSLDVLQGKVVCFSACSGQTQRSYASPTDPITATTILVALLREASRTGQAMRLRELFMEFRVRMLDRMAGSLYHQRFRSLPEKVQAAIQKCQSPEISASCGLDDLLDQALPF